MGEGFGVDVAEAVHCVVLYPHGVGDFVKTFLAQGRIVYHDGIVEVAAFYVAGAYERLDFAYEHECAGACYLGLEFIDVFHRRVLVGEHGRFEVHFHFHAEFVVGENEYFRSGGFVGKFYFVLDYVEILFGFLLGKAGGIDGLKPQLGTAVKDGYFRSVDANERIVHARCVERSHKVFDGAHRDFAAGNDSAALRAHYIFGKSVDYGLAFKVGALEFVTVAFGGWHHGSFHHGACVQSFACEGERFAEGELLHCCMMCF